MAKEPIGGSFIMKHRIFEFSGVQTFNTNQVDRGKPDGFLMVEGEEVKFKKFPNLKLFVYQRGSDGKYVVSEFWSGCSLPSASKSKRYSIQLAREALNRAAGDSSWRSKHQPLWSISAGVAHHGVANGNMASYADYIVGLVKELVKK